MEHQHFNSEPGKGCVWVAFLHEHIMENLALLFGQVEKSPQYKSQQKLPRPLTRGQKVQACLFAGETDPLAVLGDSSAYSFTPVL